MRRRKQTEQAKGFAYTDTDPNVKIAVTMPRADFNALREKALAFGWSISEVIREYVSTGILVDKEMGEWPELAKENEQVCTANAPVLRELLGVKTET